ncbi:unnamed protein product [Protopolystoma xenopodis]|uniref:Uncharacterized protein n=1 Tax=Protopolystoma xenopodis TaxID=117903 RepID=A0A3S5BKI6_9PLAT|nr:unnamed protein product [Protopolystoma xenopodis]
MGSYFLYVQCDQLSGMLSCSDDVCPNRRALRTDLKLAGDYAPNHMFILIVHGFSPKKQLSSLPSTFHTTCPQLASSGCTDSEFQPVLSRAKLHKLPVR